jgi:hypothetical protein
MARSFVQGGVAATGLATGRPYIRRIVRIGGNGTPNRQAAGLTNGWVADDFTCSVNGSGNLVFTAGAAAVQWNAGDGASAVHTGGELLYVDFPATTRTLSVQLEHATANVRCKVMLSAEGQVVRALDSFGNVTATTSTMNPISNGNYIEISDGDTATINARTRGVFILIQKFENAAIVETAAAGLYDGAAGATDDFAALLVTAVLDHEGFDTTGKHGVQTNTVASARAAATGVYDGDPLKKIWHKLDGVG